MLVFIFNQLSIQSVASVDVHTTMFIKFSINFEVKKTRFESLVDPIDLSKVINFYSSTNQTSVSGEYDFVVIRFRLAISDTHCT